MTPAEAATNLNASKYGEEGSAKFFREMNDAGLVAVFGASDDLMEFRGAIDDEIGAYNGTTAYLTSSGLLQNDCENDNCPHFKKLKKAAATIRAIWDSGGFSWRYETEIPHEKFVVNEDGEGYCEGIVFALADVLDPVGNARGQGASSQPAESSGVKTGGGE